MFLKRTEKAQADWPKTQALKKGGVRVSGRYLQPSLAKPMKFIYGISSIFVVMWAAAQAGDNTGAITVGVIVGLLLVFAYQRFWIPLFVGVFGKFLDVRLFPDMIQVRQGFGFKNYARSMPIEFRIDRHQRAMKEQAKENELNKKQPTTYREAIEVVMQYGEIRVVIAEMPELEMEKARALTIRLGSLNANLEQALSGLAAGHLSPAPAAGDFGPTPDLR
jgi:hypothetical protein